MKIFFLSLLLLFSSVAYSQTLKVGMRVQKTNGMYWENGISAQYTFANFKPNQFFVGFDYVTSRLGTAMNSNAIKQDNYLISGSWFFNKGKQYHFVTRLNFGYFYSDLEEEVFDEIPNTSFLFSPEVGFTYEFNKIPMALNLGTGYYLFLAEDGYSPGTLQPFFYHLDIYYVLFKKKGK